jgi:hypothetical protein
MGWRFWRVYRASGGIVVETGAVDEPASKFARLGNLAFGAKNDVKRLWAGQMRDALQFGGGGQGSGPFDLINGAFDQSRKQEYLKLVQQ